MEEFFKSLQPELANSNCKDYTCSVQATFISKISWLFQTHEHTSLRYLTEVLEGLLLCLNPNGPLLPWAFSSSLSGMTTKLLKPPLLWQGLLLQWPLPLVNPSTKLSKLSM